MGSNGKHFIGIDLGGTNIQAGIVSRNGKIIARDKIKTKAAEGSDVVIKRICQVVTDVMKKSNMDHDAIQSIGVGAPGAIDVEKGIILNAPNLRWTNLPLTEILSRELQAPVVVDNDANVGAWGECKAGAGTGFDDMMGIVVGTGIGACIILGGNIYYGHFKTAGEIGHTIIDANAPLGMRTVENLASRTSIVNQLTQLIQCNHQSVITELTGGDLSKIRSKVLAESLKRKDPLAREVISQAAKIVGTAIANAVTLLSLPCVVVGGGVTEALGKPWVDEIRAAFEKFAFPSELKSCKILPSALGDDAGVVGAAMLARDSL